MLPRKFTQVWLSKLLKLKSTAVLDVETGASIRVVSPATGAVSNTISTTELSALDGNTATGAELTSVVAGNTATAAEITRTCDVSTRIVATTAATLAVTLAAHENRTVVLNSTHTQTLTLPAASGSGSKFRFVVGVTGTDGSKVIQVANTADVITGAVTVNSTATNQASSFLTSATSDTVTLDNTTTGGIAGTEVVIEDIAANTFLVKVWANASGTVATPFSAAV